MKKTPEAGGGRRKQANNNTTNKQQRQHKKGLGFTRDSPLLPKKSATGHF